KGLGALVLCAGFSGAVHAQVFLDADTPATGSNLVSEPLVTAFGTITFTGEFTTFTDPEFTAAGASGNNFDHTGSPDEAVLSFSFPVCSITFIYGGNGGDIFVEARGAGGLVQDSFFQADTDGGQPAGPETLSGPSIRQLAWFETAGAFAPLDNIEVEPCVGFGDAAPVPADAPWALVLLMLAMLGTGAVLVRRFG
ncbi:MAG: hypothetical protein R3233_00975, partial [Xanthomonadales bacterium]|nr:hypothetical protein [Xanthomonadales bacterium]